LIEDNQNNNYIRTELINYLIENKLVGELIGDKYGNYVIQKALQMSNGISFLAIIHVNYIYNIFNIKIGYKSCNEAVEADVFW
jgi:hypothetical protein